MTDNDNYTVIMTGRLTSDADALYEVVREVRRLFHRLANCADRLHADLGVSAAQRAVLEALADDGISTVPDLARRKGVTRQHIQVLANQLQSAGLVETHPNPAHQRSSLLALTPAGRRAFDSMRAREERLFASMRRRFKTLQLEQVAQILRDIGDAADDLVGHAHPPHKTDRHVGSRQQFSATHLSRKE
ncbi:MAG TPA: MarR family winged helix-turn-helix transcriptional regulator [Anaeromyxobacteraceae bacterium]|nr:MarR family winged helix-turn-helix transcriptional regulator [Anaeromyxobacteraceae bacterium]